MINMEQAPTEDLVQLAATDESSAMPPLADMIDSSMQWTIKVAEVLNPVQPVEIL